MGVLIVSRINKVNFGLFILWIFVSIGAFYEYTTTGKVHTKWGDSYGISGLHTLIAYWVLTVLFGLFSIKRKKQSETTVTEPTTLICPKCETPATFKKNDSKSKRCSKCDTEMVPLEGFYVKNNH